MAKGPKETFGDPGNTGNEGVEEVISPLSFQFTGKGTPQWPCQLDEEEPYPIPKDTVGFIPKCVKES
jgi:hypothetical protein